MRASLAWQANTFASLSQQQSKKGNMAMLIVLIQCALELRQLGASTCRPLTAQIKLRLLLGMRIGGVACRSVHTHSLAVVLIRK
jgi:hypothetical protein